MAQGQYREKLVKPGNGVPVTQIRGVPVLLVEGELHDGEDNAFVRWLHRARHLGSMVALRAMPIRQTNVSNGNSVMNTPS